MPITRNNTKFFLNELIIYDTLMHIRFSFGEVLLLASLKLHKRQ